MQIFSLPGYYQSKKRTRSVQPPPVPTALPSNRRLPCLSALLVAHPDSTSRAASSAHPSVHRAETSGPVPRRVCRAIAQPSNHSPGLRSPQCGPGVTSEQNACLSAPRHPQLQTPSITSKVSKSGPDPSLWRCLTLVPFSPSELRPNKAAPVLVPRPDLGSLAPLPRPSFCRLPGDAPRRVR